MHDPPADPLLVRLLDEARLAHVRASDDRRHVLAGVAAASATLVGTLADLADAGRPLTVRTRGGRRHAGSLVLVGLDFAVVEGAAGQLWCPLRAMAGVAAGGSPVTAGAGSAADLVLVDALALLAETEPRVAVDLSSGEAVAGELAGVGVDVVRLRLDGGASLYVPSDSLDGLLRSG
ncbi:MAG: hypothetical protein AB7H43_02235 [Acidimicrobiia bacterium]